MRVERVKVYQFSELDDKAKEKARVWYRQGMDFPWSDEYRQTLDLFAKAFNVRVRDWEVSTYGHSYARIEVNVSHEVNALCRDRLATYLQNNFGYLLWEPKRIVRYFRDGELYPRPIVGHGITTREYASKCQSEETCCPFTGFCADDDILAPMREFIARPDWRDYESLMQSCVDAWVASYRADMEHSESDEAVDDAMEANEYEFTENGERW